MASGYPHYPPYPQPPAPRRPGWDVASTAVLGILLVGACGLGAMYSLFAGMSTAVCSGTDRCNHALINDAYLVAWGGIVLALAVAAVGIVTAAKRRRVMVGWPILGWVIFLATYIIGGFMLNAGLGN